MSTPDQPPPETDRPRLRPLEAYPVMDHGQRMLALRDPSRLAPGIVRLPAPTVAVVQLFDGESSREEICAMFAQRYNRPLDRGTLDRLIGQLDDALLLDTEKFRQHSARVFADFARAPERPALFAGESYPGEAAELGQYLTAFFTHSHGPGAPSGREGNLPRALIAPHIDFHRGGPAYAWAYKLLAEAKDRPELVVIFGTDHIAGDRPFTFTRKHYSTPFGVLPTDTTLVDAIANTVGEKLGPQVAQGLFYDEHHHRGEHSIEFQAVWLRHVFGDAFDGENPIRVLPILTGSFRHLVDDKRDPATDAEIHTVLEAIKTAVAGKRVLWLGAADLAHVGPRYGDADPLSASDRESLERRDQQTLEPVLRGDGAAWVAEIAREQDRRNVCGLSPIWATVSGAGADLQGKLLAYGQCAADESGGSLVSIASIVY
jgi:AmmeMemoRadiSam system protein B